MRAGAALRWHADWALMLTGRVNDGSGPNDPDPTAGRRGRCSPAVSSPEMAVAVALRSKKRRGGVPVVSCSQRGGADTRRDTADSMEISGMILASENAGAR